MNKPTSQLKKKLDKIFSEYIRMRDKGQCYTCPKQLPWKAMQNGHFVPRQYLKTRWDERNCNCQCYACNMLYNGQPSAYAKRLKEQYGEGIIEELEKNRKEVCKLDWIWYEDKINYYKERIKEYE